MTGDFKDHFSEQSEGYAKHRPTYPPELFNYLASLTSHNDIVWDCATGSGQAAVELSKHFSNVIATDASRSQIDAALRHPQVEYRIAKAEESGLADASIDLLTVGQALHWFEESAFMAEAQRVLRPNGVLAVWCYELCHVNDKCDAVVDRLYTDIVGEFWPPERVIIEEGYSHVALPGTVVSTPEFEMTLEWHATDMLGYVRTWSACKLYEATHGADPVLEIEGDLLDAWGSCARRATWPLSIKVSRPNTLLE